MRVLASVLLLCALDPVHCFFGASDAVVALVEQLVIMYTESNP
jgi:hypothetical protein